MGITLKGYRVSNDVTVSGFFRFRHDIASMLSNDIGRLYIEMIDTIHDSKEVQKDWENRMNRAIDDYLSHNKKSMEKVIDFLFLPDADESISYGTCKLIIRLIDSQDRSVFDNTLYGYAGWGDKACHGRGIYAILKSCADNKKPMIWY